MIERIKMGNPENAEPKVRAPRALPAFWKKRQNFAERQFCGQVGIAPLRKALRPGTYQGFLARNPPGKVWETTPNHRPKVFSLHAKKAGLLFGSRHFSPAEPTQQARIFSADKLHSDNSHHEPSFMRTAQMSCVTFHFIQFFHPIWRAPYL